MFDIEDQQVLEHIRKRPRASLNKALSNKKLSKQEMDDLFL